MASQFRNSNLGYYLYMTIVIFIAVASVFFFWYMISGFGIGKYSENTYVGSVYIGGLTPREAELKVTSSITQWLDDEDVVFEVGYQGYYYQIDRELTLSFDFEASMKDIVDGRYNELIVSFSDIVRSQILDDIEREPFMTTLINQFDLEKVLDDLVKDAAAMKTFSSKELANYIVDTDALITQLGIISRTVPLSIDSEVIFNKIIAQYPSGIITINSNSTFSVLNRFNADFTTNELSLIGSLLLDLINPTHMIIYERYHQPDVGSYLVDEVPYTLSNFPYFGSNAYIRRTSNHDLKFQNNSASSFSIEFELQTNIITAKLIGTPFLNEITIDIDEQPFTDQVSGNTGMIVIVTRNTYDLNGDLISTKRIFTEYYPPQSS